MNAKEIQNIPVIKGFIIVVPDKGKTSYFVGAGAAIGSKSSQNVKTTTDQCTACFFGDKHQAQMACNLLNHLLGLVSTANHPACFVTEMSWPR